ncbi:unnamed protein product [Dicrocoelium dendriticum]|nr:unnamed protein product [Dicrocoelium dendriticum]
MVEYARLLIDEALKESGWKSNFAFPVASEENKYLIDLLGEVKVKTRVLEEEALQFREKNNKLRSHLALVQQERAMTQAFLLERQKECDSLQHDLCLAEREIGRTRQDLRQLKEKRKEVSERIGSFENQIFTKSNEMNSIKSQLNEDQHLIDEYLDACEDDVRLRERLETMRQLDDSRFATLNSQAARLSERRTEVRRKLDTVVMKNEALRLQVEATSERCRAENQTRREVLQVWEGCVAQLIKRDDDYKVLGKVSRVNDSFVRQPSVNCNSRS